MTRGVKLDRSDLSRIQSGTGIPVTTTPGNVYLDIVTGVVYVRKSSAVAWEKLEKTQFLDWQDSVISRFDPTSGLPSSPSEEDRYIASATANGWTDDYIYEYVESAWQETVADEGMSAWIEDEDDLYVFNGSNWVKFGSTVTHNNLSDIQGGTDTQNYHLTSADYTTLRGGSSDASSLHQHDDRYYTESEIDSLLGALNSDRIDSVDTSVVVDGVSNNITFESDGVQIAKMNRSYGTSTQFLFGDGMTIGQNFAEFGKTGQSAIALTQSTDQATLFDGPYFIFKRGRGSSLVAPSGVQTGDNLGGLNWKGRTTTGAWTNVGLLIGTATKDFFSNGTMDLILKLGSDTPTEKFRFTNGTRLGIGTDSPGGSLGLLDANTYITRDGSNNLSFTDAVTGTKTLAELTAAPSVSLDNAYNSGSSIAVDGDPVTLTVGDGDNNLGFKVVQNDSTNDPSAIEVENNADSAGGSASILLSGTNRSIGSQDDGTNRGSIDIIAASTLASPTGSRTLGLAAYTFNDNNSEVEIVAKQMAAGSGVGTIRIDGDLGVLIGNDNITTRLDLGTGSYNTTIDIGSGSTTGGARTIVIGNTSALSDLDIQLRASSDADILFLARGSSSVTFNQSGDVDLSGFTATSIIGALNELKSGAGATVLSDLTDADTTGATQDQVLAYNSSSGEWTPATIDIVGLTGSAALDFGSISAGSTAELTITVTGVATTGWVVISTPEGTIESDLIWSSYVSSSNTVTVRLFNAGSITINPASRTWNVEAREV